MDPLSVVDRAWPLLHRVVGSHTAVYRITRGRIGGRGPGTARVLLLDHRGAKSGTVRTVPLFYLREGDDIALVASKAGYPKHPAWLHNLRANPETTVQIGGSEIPVRAREATESERTRLWPAFDEVYPGYADYRKRAQGRVIPIVLLSPR